MRILPILVAGALALLAIPHAAAGCDTLQTTPFFFVPIETPAATFYLYHDAGCDPECHGPDPWIIQESNGIAGAQFIVHFHDDRCVPVDDTLDTVIF